MPPVATRSPMRRIASREQLAILGHRDRARIGADQLHAVLLEHAAVCERQRDVERRLSAHRGQQRVRALALDHLLDELGRHRLDVRPVRELGIGHDRGRIRVHEDDRVPLFAQRLRRLRARVVELGALADHDRAGAYEQNLLYVSATRHESALRGWSRASDAEPSPLPRAALRRCPRAPEHPRDERARDPICNFASTPARARMRRASAAISIPTPLRDVVRLARHAPLGERYVGARHVLHVREITNRLGVSHHERLRRAAQRDARDARAPAPRSRATGPDRCG